MISLPLMISLIAIVFSTVTLVLVINRIKIVERRLRYVYDLITMKRRKKHGRIRKRYIVFAVISEQDLGKKDIEKAIRSIWKEIFGELSLSRADPQLIYFEPSIQRGIIRIRHVYKKECLALLGIIHETNGVKCLLIPITVSGTLKRAQKKLYMLRRDLQPK